VIPAAGETRQGYGARAPPLSTSASSAAVTITWPRNRSGVLPFRRFSGFVPFQRCRLLSAPSLPITGARRYLWYREPLLHSSPSNLTPLGACGP
jgi:hypothetical protein